MGSTMVKFGSSELYEQVWAKLTQISKHNKPRIHNKHLLIWILRQKWDRVWGQLQVGSTRSKVKPMVNTWSLPGEGLEKPKIGLWDPLGWPQSTTKGGSVAEGLKHRGCSSPAAYFEGQYGPQ